MPRDQEDRTPPDPNAGGVVSQGAPWQAPTGTADPTKFYRGGDTPITDIQTQLLYAQQSKARGWVRMTDGSWWPPDKVRQLGAQARVSPTQDINAQTVNPDWAPGGGIAAGGAGFGAGKPTDSATAERILSGAASGGGSGGTGGTGAGGGTSGSGATGLTAKEYEVYKAQATSALHTLGVLDYEPTDSEIASFFASGFDAEAIGNYYMTDPTLVARQPGLPYGVSRETYQQRLTGYQQAWQASFGGQKMPDAPKPGASQTDIQGNLVGYAMKQGIDPSAFGQTVEKFRQTQGRAPTQSDYAAFTQQQAQSTPSRGGGGPTGGPVPAQQRETRPAIGR